MTMNSYDTLLKEIRSKNRDKKPSIVEIWHDDFMQNTFTVFCMTKGGDRIEFVLSDAEYHNFLDLLNKNNQSYKVLYFG